MRKRQKSAFLSQIFVENFFLRFSIFFDKNLRPDSCHFSFSTKIDFCRKWPGFLSKMKKMKKMKRLFWSRSAQSDFCRNRFLSISVFFIFPDKNPTDKNWSAQTLYSARHLYSTIVSHRIFSIFFSFFYQSLPQLQLIAYPRGKTEREKNSCWKNLENF